MMSSMARSGAGKDGVASVGGSSKSVGSAGMSELREHAGSDATDDFPSADPGFFSQASIGGRAESPPNGVVAALAPYRQRRPSLETKEGALRTTAPERAEAFGTGSAKKVHGTRSVENVIRSDRADGEGGGKQRDVPLPGMVHGAAEPSRAATASVSASDSTGASGTASPRPHAHVVSHTVSAPAGAPATDTHDEHGHARVQARRTAPYRPEAGARGGLSMPRDKRARIAMRLKLAAQASRTAQAVNEDAMFRKLQGPVVSDEEEPVGPTSWAARLVVRPGSRFYNIWDAAHLFAILYLTLRIPYLTAFDVSTDIFLYVLDRIVDVFFLGDFVLRFRLAYMDDGELITDSWHILRRYATSYLIVDAAHVIGGVIVPWAFTTDIPLGQVDDLRLLQIVRVLRVPAIAVDETIGRAFDVGERGRTVLQQLKLVFYISMTGHVTACIWYRIARSEGFGDDSWTTLYGINDLPASSKYLSAIYWSFTTLTTVGYGDVSAHTDRERVFALFVIMAGAVVFAMIVGQMSTLAQDMNAAQRAHVKKMAQVDAFLKHHNLPRGLRTDVRHYFERMHQLHPIDNEREILSRLSPSLRRTVLVTMHARFVQLFPVFKFDTVGFQSMILGRLQHAYALPGEYVIFMGEVPEQMYFLVEGSVHLVDADGKTVVTQKGGSFFGEEGVLAGRLAERSVRAATACDMMTLTRSNLHSVLRVFPAFEIHMRQVAKLRIIPTQDALVRDGQAAGSLHHMERRISLAQAGVAQSSRSVLRSSGAGSTSSLEGSQRTVNSSGEVSGSGGSAGKLRKAATIGGRRARPQTPPPFVKDWVDVSASAKAFDRYYESMLKRRNQMLADAYHPDPIDVSRLDLPPEMDELVDLLLRNAHEIWTANKVRQGWTWGPTFSATERTHPNICPYDALSEAERRKHRKAQPAIQILKLLIWMQYVVKKTAEVSSDVYDAWGPPTLLRLGSERSFALSAKGAMSSPAIEIAAPSTMRDADAEARRMRRQLSIEDEAEKAIADDASDAGSLGSERSISSGTKRRSSSRSLPGIRRTGSRGGSPIDARRKSIAAARRLAQHGLVMGIFPTVEVAMSGSTVLYNPRPIQPRESNLSKDARAAAELIARNQHEAWVAGKLADNWKYGLYRDDRIRVHNALLPYEHLSEEQKDQDRAGVIQTLSLIRSLGYVILRTGPKINLARLGLKIPSDSNSQRGGGGGGKSRASPRAADLTDIMSDGAEIGELGERLSIVEESVAAVRSTAEELQEDVSQVKQTLLRIETALLKR